MLFTPTPRCQATHPVIYTQFLDIRRRYRALSRVIAAIKRYPRKNANTY